MNVRNDKLIRWLVTAMIACGTAWAGWVSTNIAELHDKQASLEATIAEMNGKLDVVVDWVKHGEHSGR